MRRSFLFLTLLILGLGVLLFHVKYRVVGMEQELAQVRRNIRESEKALHVLKAEWEHLLQPERLQGLAEKHLGLVPFNQKQYIALSQIPFRPDPVVALVENALKEKIGMENAPHQSRNHLVRFEK